MDVPVMLYTRRMGEVSAVELFGGDAVSLLKTTVSDTLFCDGAELDDDSLVADCLEAGAVVDVAPFVPAAYEDMVVVRRAPVCYPSLVWLADDGRVAEVTADCRVVLWGHHGRADADCALASGDDARGYADLRQIVALAVGDAAAVAYVLTPARTLTAPLAGGGACASVVHPIQRASPLALVHCAGAGVFGVFAYRGGLSVVETGSAEVGCLFLRFAASRASAFAGLPGRRVAVAYDEGVHVFAVAGGKKLLSVGLRRPPIGLAASSEHEVIAAHTEGLSVVRVDGGGGGGGSGKGATGCEAVREVPFPPSAGCMVPSHVRASSTALLIVNRYEWLLLRHAS